MVRDMARGRGGDASTSSVGAGHRDAAAREVPARSPRLPHFDPDVHLRRIGVANQTTMLARESLAIGEAVGQAMARAHGAEYRAAHFRTFDTICSATQDRQDAVNALLKEPLDVMLVVGGYNSSNTISLAALCAEKVRTYHIEDAGRSIRTRRVLHRVAATHGRADAPTGCRRAGPCAWGLTAGASTPNNKIGETVARIFATRASPQIRRVRFPFLSRPPRHSHRRRFGSLELRGGTTRVVIVPALGGNSPSW